MKHIIFFFIVVSTFSVSCAEDDISYDSTGKVNSQLLNTCQKPFTLTTVLSEKTEYTANPLSAQRNAGRQQKTQKSPFRKFLYRHRYQIIFTGVGLAALLTTGIFNAAAENQYEREQDLYDDYMDAVQGSDFDKLWNDYTEEKEKTDTYLNLRGIFGIAAGAVGVSLLFSIAVEKEF